MEQHNPAPLHTLSIRRLWVLLGLACFPLPVLTTLPYKPLPLPPFTTVLCTHTCASRLLLAMFCALRQAAIHFLASALLAAAPSSSYLAAGGLDAAVGAGAAAAGAAAAAAAAGLAAGAGAGLAAGAGEGLRDLLASSSTLLMMSSSLSPL